MKNAIIHRLLGALSEMMMVIEVPSDDYKELDSMYSKYNSKLRASDADPVSPTEVEEDGKVTESGLAPAGLKYSSDDALIVDAHSAILSMSKPSISGMSKKIKVGATRGKKIFQSLIDDGHINEHGNAVPPALKKDGKKDKGKAGKPGKSEDVIVSADNISSYIDNLPMGDNVMLSAPFNLLVVLSEKRRKPYLTGVDITQVLTTDGIAHAVKEGADPSLVNVILKRADKKVKQVDDQIDVDNKSEQGKKAGKMVAARIGIIGELGEVLFNHMVRGGFNKEVLEDFNEIAKAVKAQEV